MTLDELRSFRNATPFRPFTLVTSTGDHLAVPHPDSLVVPSARPGVTREDYLIHYPPAGPGFQWIAIEHIVSARSGMEEPKTE
jgi:hypothetical protein